MKNARTIAELEKTITRLTALRERLVAAEEKASAPVKRTLSAKAPVAKNIPLKTKAVRSTMSPEGRERIAAAQRKRWAAVKKAAKKAAR